MSTRQDGLFAEYINMFFQFKQASEWPRECENDDDAKEQYLRKYEKIESIVLGKNNIEILVYARSRNFDSILFEENSASELICLRPRS